MKNKYNVLIKSYPASARNRRLKELGVAGGAGATVIAGGGNTGSTIDPTLLGDGHTHANLAVLNRLAVDEEDYVRLQVNNPEAGKDEEQPVTIKEKLKAGYADKAKDADHADMAHDLDADSPVNDRFLSAKEDDEAAGLISFAKGIISDDFAFFNNGLLVRSKETSRELHSSYSDALLENSEPESLSAEIIEDKADDLEVINDSLMEVAAAEIVAGATTLGGLDNVVDEADVVNDSEDYVIVKLKGASGWTLLPARNLGGGGSEVQRTVQIQNDLDSRNLSASKGEACLLKFTFISQERYGIGGQYENTGERGLCEVSVKNAVNTEFTVVKQMYIQSGYVNTLDVAEFLTSGSNQIMLKVTGEITEMTTPSFVYTVQLTSLSIAANNFRWWTAFTGVVGIPLNIGGNISKTLYATITGGSYSRSYEVSLGTTVYTETAYNYQLEHPGRSGVYKVSMYVANTDGSIRTRTISYNIICAVAGDRVKLMAVNNVLAKATNWAENSLFDYSIYDGSNAISSARFIVKKEGATVFSSDEDSIPASTMNTFSLPMEIETIDNADFSITVNVMDGNTTLTPALNVPVNNSLGFSSVAGAVFYMNPRTRSNNQSNYRSVINEMDGGVTAAVWKGMNWGNDGWATDADTNKVLRLMAGSGVTIGYKVFAKESARLGKTVEIDYKIDNVTDFNHSAIRISGEDDSFVGLRIFPDNVVMFSNALKNTDNQSINLFEGKRLRFTLVIMPDAYGNSGFNLCIVYINGVKNREFTYENNDYFAQNSDIVIGSDYADVDVYGVRVYDSALTSEAVLRNYINWLGDNTEKNSIKAKNDVMDGNGSEIDFENTVDQYNVFVFDNLYPSMANPNEMPGMLEVYFSDHPEWNVKISNVKAKGQGTSSMRYWKWNVRFTLDKKLSVVTHADGSTNTGGWAMVPSIASATKITAKKNFASSMQSHKVGSVNSVEELYRAMGYKNEAMQTAKYANARVAVYQLPFVAFERSLNDEGKTVYTFMGLYTMGPDKGDKNSFGHDTDLFPGLLAIEGSDNSPLCTLFRVPWNTQRMAYNEDEEAFQYNGANSWDFGAGDTANISKWIPAYNIAYICSNRLKPFNGTLAELNVQVATYRNEPYEFWIAKAGDANQYNVYYYEASAGLFTASDTGSGTINLKTQLVDKGYGLAMADLTGKTAAQLNDLFIAARIQKFRKEAPAYWDIDDAILHRNWVEFHAGTDNRAKNTYPYCFGTATSKWKWRYDDLDTIFDTDNQGQAKKGYYVEYHDTYSTGGSVWNGETSNFWNLIDLAFPDEVFASMRKMMLAMEKLSGLNSGTDFDKLFAYYQKYYFSQAQEYFSQNLYNADARFSYENAKLAYIDGRYTNDTDPITQSLGDHYAAEQRWITKRILYMMSKYSFGLFSADGTDNITVRAAGNTITYQLTPAMDIYPAIANGTSIIRGKRTKAGEVSEMLIELSGSGDQQNTIQGASYLQDIGDWYDKNVTGSMIIQGRMLREVRLGSKTHPIVISVSSLTLSNCVSLQKLVLSNIRTLTGTLNLTACTHLKEVYADGTALSQIRLPQGGGLEHIEFSAYNQYLMLSNYPLLSTAGVDINLCKKIITDFFVVNCPNVGSMDLLVSIMDAQSEQGNNHQLKRIRAVGFENTYNSSAILDKLAVLANGTYEGLSSEGLSGEDTLPVLDGTLHVHANVYQDSVDALRNTFRKLTLNIVGNTYIRFKDAEVQRIAVNAYSKDKVGVLKSDAEDVTFITDTVFKGNTKISDFSDFGNVFTKVNDIKQRAFEGCTNLKWFTLPEVEGGISIGLSAFSKTQLNENSIDLRKVSVLKYNSFQGCIFTNVFIPSSVDISDAGSAFQANLSLETAEIEEGPTYIKSMFADCPNLTQMVFPSTTQVFSAPIIQGCLKIQRIVVKATVPPLFENADALGWTSSPSWGIYVPEASVAAYKSAPVWQKYASRIYPLLQE